MLYNLTELIEKIIPGEDSTIELKREMPCTAIGNSGHCLNQNYDIITL